MSGKRIEKEALDALIDSLRRRQLSISDIAGVLGRSKSAARACVDTLSFSYPIYETNGGMFSMLGGATLPKPPSTRPTRRSPTGLSR
jgi:hypothetical protein